MARRRKSGRGRLVVALLAAAAVVAVLWLNRERLAANFHGTASRESAALDAPADRVETGNEGRRVRVTGTLAYAQPPRDAQLGVSADTAVLFRDVEMYAWHEVCSAGACRYDARWTAHPEDSHKFREPAGHDNPVSPLASTRVAAEGLHLGAFAIDPALLEALPATPLAVNASQLPPNLAATFRVADGALIAGGDAAQPRVGALRVRFRTAAAASVTVTGVQHGNRLSTQ